MLGSWIISDFFNSLLIFPNVLIRILVTLDAKTNSYYLGVCYQQDNADSNTYRAFETWNNLSLATWNYHSVSQFKTSAGKGKSGEQIV